MTRLRKTADFSIELTKYFSSEARFRRAVVSRQCPFQMRTGHFRNLLWLIPFTLAKKLLTRHAMNLLGASSQQLRGAKKTWGEDPLFGMNARGYNKKNYFGFEKFSLEETRFLPIIKYSRARDAHCSLENNLSGSSHELRNKIYPAYARDKKLCP